MNKCFLCGDEYESNKGVEILYRGKDDFIKKVVKDGKPYELCDRCIKAMVFCASITGKDIKLKHVHPTYVED